MRARQDFRERGDGGRERGPGHDENPGEEIGKRDDEQYAGAQGEPRTKSGADDGGLGQTSRQNESLKNETA